MLARVRTLLLLGLSVLLILTLGLLAAWGQVSTADDVAAAQREDRLRLQTTLGGLVEQFLSVTLLETQRGADAQPWELTQGSAKDRESLHKLATTSPFASYGATLTSLLGKPLSSWSTATLPAATDPGLRPLTEALRAGKPGVSDVMTVGAHSVVAFAVPVHRGGDAVALLVSFADVRAWPLQAYNQALELGRTAEPYVLDSSGRIAAAGRPEDVGTVLQDLPEGARDGGEDVMVLERGGRDQVLSWSGAGFGWTAVTAQDEAPFTRDVQASSRRNALALIVLLTLVVIALAWLHWSRQQALRRLADDRLYDPLTGLAQRRLLEIRLEAAMARHRRTGLPLAVLYLDLDGFKAVNDQHGHNVGDQVLASVATRMNEAVREDDFLVRLGGDEFAVVLEATTAGEADEVRARLHQVVEQPLPLGIGVLHPRVSIGGAVLTDGSLGDSLLRAADLAMYQSKQAREDSPIAVLDGRVTGSPQGSHHR